MTSVGGSNDYQDASSTANAFCKQDDSLYVKSFWPRTAPSGKDIIVKCNHLESRVGVCSEQRRTIAMFHTGVATSPEVESRPSARGPGWGSKMRRPLIMNSSAKTAPMAAAPRRASTCDAGTRLLSITGAAIVRLIPHTTCSAGTQLLSITGAAMVRLMPHTTCSTYSFIQKAEFRQPGASLPRLDVIDFKVAKYYCTGEWRYHSESAESTNSGTQNLKLVWFAIHGGKVLSYWQTGS